MKEKRKVYMEQDYLFTEYDNLTQTRELQMMKSMLYIMPPMMTFVCISMPAGLCLYWSIFSLLGIGQQLIMNKQKAKQMVIIFSFLITELLRRMNMVVC